MATLQASKIEDFLRHPQFRHSIYLIYGPDEGLVSERADLLAEKSGVDASDPFSLIRMTADDASSEPGKVYEELSTINMFGGKRLVRIFGSTRRDLFKAVKPVLDAPPQDALVILEAGDLKKNAALRRNLEKHENALCIPCYRDNSTAIDALIQSEILANGLQINHQARDELKSLLGDNRKLSRGELQKLALYCHGKPEITLEDVHNVVGDSSAFTITELIDAAACGQTGSVPTYYQRTLQAGQSPDIILLNTLKHFQMLYSLNTQAGASRKSVTSLISGIRPPIHFSRKQHVTQAATKWGVESLMRTMNRLDSAMLQCRKNPSAAQAICSMTLTAISLEANRPGHK